MNVIAFRYDVKKSFLTGTREITVPKGQISYKALRETQLDQETYNIIYPRGECLPAWMYYGVAGYGSYYQLKVSANQPNIPRYLQIDDRLFVILIRYYRINYAILEYIQKPKIRYKNQ